MNYVLSVASHQLGYQSKAGDVVIDALWRVTVFYQDYEYSDELILIGQVKLRGEYIAERSDSFQENVEIVEKNI